jgi:Arc/MetJ-type ribon-helix-helix transcriptional regulator
VNEIIKILIMKLLRRFGFVSQSPMVRSNIKQLRERQTQQLSLLASLRNKVDQQILSKPVDELVKIDDETVFNTFTTRCLNP